MKNSQSASKQIDGSLLIHPVVGMTKPGDVNHHPRPDYKALFDNYYDKGTLLGLLPLAMRMGDRASRVARHHSPELWRQPLHR